MCRGRARFPAGAHPAQPSSPGLEAAKGDCGCKQCRLKRSDVAGLPPGSRISRLQNRLGALRDRVADPLRRAARQDPRGRLAPGDRNRDARRQGYSRDQRDALRKVVGQASPPNSRWQAASARLVISLTPGMRSVADHCNDQGRAAVLLGGFQAILPGDWHGETCRKIPMPACSSNSRPSLPVALRGQNRRSGFSSSRRKAPA